MARSLLNGAMAFPAEVARFLMVDPGDVRRMISMDRLPAIEVPKARRKVLRIWLPDFHRWLLARSPEAIELRNYAAFQARFDEMARGHGAAVGEEGDD